LRRTLFGLVIVAGSPPAVIAQGAPGTNIEIAVVVAGVAVRGDTTEITYVLRNEPRSAEQLFSFTVDAPSPVLRISIPQPEEDWLTNTKYRSRSVADWTVLGEQMQPGEVSPTLSFTARGLPAIVTYWAQGYAPPPTLKGGEGSLPPSDPLVENSIRGSTVGIEPFPRDPRPGSLLTRLLSLTNQSCGPRSWIASVTICSSLRAKLERAREAVIITNHDKAHAQLQGFLTELGAHHGSAGTGQVTDNAFWLLKVNAEFVSGLILPRGSR
jgi:hypothetical protein